VTYIGSGAFSGCTNLASITIGAGNQNFAIQDGILYNKAKTQIIYVPRGISGSVIIPDSVTGGMDGGAFAGNTGLTSIIIGNGVTSIGNGAFADCTNLVNITIGSGVTSIGRNAFENTGIWNNAEDNSVVYVGKWAVGYKGTLTAILLRADTVGISEMAFYQCYNLTSIVIPNGVAREY
jgi:hypothetical protein